MCFILCNTRTYSHTISRVTHCIVKYIEHMYVYTYLDHYHSFCREEKRRKKEANVHWHDSFVFIHLTIPSITTRTNHYYSSSSFCLWSIWSCVVEVKRQSFVFWFSFVWIRIVKVLVNRSFSSMKMEFNYPKRMIHIQNKLFSHQKYHS